MFNPMRFFAKKAAIRPEEYVGADEARNEEVVREHFAVKAKRYLRHLPLAQETVAMYFCMLDPKTPLWVKATVATALAYFILPLDAIPDLMPLVGLSDDAGVLATALTAISAYVTDEHRARAKAWMAHEHVATEGALASRASGAPTILIATGVETRRARAKYAARGGAAYGVCLHSCGSSSPQVRPGTGRPRAGAWRS